LTLGCARCHNHKYDPLTQREFYQVFAYFNSIPELGRTLKYGNSPPTLSAPTRPQQQKLKTLDLRVAEAEGAFLGLSGSLSKAQALWERKLERDRDWTLGDGLVATAAGLQGKQALSLGDKAEFGFYDKFTLAARISAENPSGPIVTRAEPRAEGEGYGVYLKDGKVQVNLVKRWLDDSIRIETKDPIALREWHHIVVSYDGSRVATGVRIYIDGVRQPTTIIVDAINQDFKTKEPLRVGGGGSDTPFEGQIQHVRVYSRALSEGEAAIISLSKSLGEIASIPDAKRTTAERDKLRQAFLETDAPVNIRDAWKAEKAARQAREAFIETVPTVMVMEELPKPKDTFLLVRGSYDRPGERVQRGVPQALSPLPPNAPQNRLGLAQWIVSPENPLTARVAVNRFWQMYFGTGIVKTVEDFGSQGEWPSNPALLDWLATEFVRSGWDMKALQKTILMSATYRQSSKVTPELLQRDPENRLFARGPRVRLPAEMVRDQALSISGLLVNQLGGPSVKPYQPVGIWRELGDKDYEPDHGDALHRRSLYTYWKRTSAPPFMATFDSALRESCTVRESRTNTPLQALNLMNDVTFVEAARKMAQRVIHDGGVAPAARLRYAFRLTLAREPAAREQEILRNALAYHRDRFSTNPKAATEFVSMGEAARDPNIDTTELASYAAVCSMLLNLDETITKE